MTLELKNEPTEDEEELDNHGGSFSSDGNAEQEVGDLPLDLSLRPGSEAKGEVVEAKAEGAETLWSTSKFLGEDRIKAAIKAQSISLPTNHNDPLFRFRQQGVRGDQSRAGQSLRLGHMHRQREILHSLFHHPTAISLQSFVAQ